MSSKTFKTVTLAESHALSAVSTKFSPNGHCLASAGSDKFCNIHDILSGNLLTKISDDYSAGLNDCAWFGDNHIVTIGDDCSIRLVDIAANKTVLSYRMQKAVPYSVIVHPFNHLITVGDTDGSVYSYHIGTKEAVQKIHAHASIVSSLCFTDDGEELLSGSYDGTIRQWIPLQRALCIRTIIPSPKVTIPISSVSYSPNNKYILASVLDNTHRLYHRHFEDSGHLLDKTLDILSYPSHIKQYMGHQNAKFSSPSRLFNVFGDRYSMISGSEDGNLILWDSNSQEISIKSKVHDGVILGLDILQKSDQECLLATCSADGTVKIHEFVDSAQPDATGLCETPCAE